MFKRSMSEHTNFILSPLSRILEEATCAVMRVPDGMCSIPLVDYLLHSVFLKMTGAQEQKFKCICWEIATRDYEFRYKWLAGQGDAKIGGCSTMEDKNKVYQLVVNHLYAPNAIQYTNFDHEYSGIRGDIVKKAKNDINRFYNTSILRSTSRLFNAFKDISKQIDANFIIKNNGIFSNKEVNSCTLTQVYEDFLYRHRNRCAHNLLSYQANFHSLNKLRDDNNVFDNYYLYYVMLILIDETITLTYRQLVKKENW